MKSSHIQNKNRFYKKPNYIRRGRGRYKKYINFDDWKSYYYANYASPNYLPKYPLYPQISPLPSWMNNEYFIQQNILYRVEQYIYSKYPYLMDINKRNANLIEKINPNCKFYVIKTLTEEDIHKSIKYNVWCSSKEGNLLLNDSYNIAKAKNGSIYLFFSSNGTERFVGVAEMKSSFDINRPFKLWTQDNVWIGLFDVQWIFIKDVPFKEFANMFITMKEGGVKPVYNAKNTQEIPFEVAKIMIDKFDKFQNSNTILEHFEYYDLRQENYEKNNNINKNHLSKINISKKHDNNNNNENKK